MPRHTWHALRTFEAMKLEFGLDDIADAAGEFLAAIHAHRVVAFYGDMGAGKTTFINAVCKVMGVKGSLSSPTFSIINEYETRDGHAVYHMDFYRLNSEEEARRAGVEDALFSNSYCFLEWPEKAPALLPNDAMHCTIKPIAGNRRQLTLKK